MKSKEEFYERLLKDELYSSIISSIDDENRGKVKGIVENMFIDVMSKVQEFSENIKKDPEALNELFKALNSADPLINGEHEKSESGKKLDA